MASVGTLPGTLNIAVKAGDELSQLVDFSISLTGYTFSTEVVSAITYEPVGTMTVSAVNLASGQVNLSMSETATAAIPPGSYLWRLIWTAPGTVRRTALEGVLEVVR